MAKELEAVSIDELKKDMQEEGYSRGTIEIVEQQAQTITPGQEHLELGHALYIAVLTDDSASIGGANQSRKDNVQDVIDGHNSIVDALTISKEKRFMLFKTQYLNSDMPLNNWVPLDKAVRMTRDNFKPMGITPLYDKTLALLSSVIFEKTEALKRGQQARWGILIITDGADEGSNTTAEEVKLILDDMRRKGELLESCQPDDMHAGSIALLGIEDGTTDFEAIAHSMGIMWIVHANRKEPQELRRAFNTFSRKVA